MIREVIGAERALHYLSETGKQRYRVEPRVQAHGDGAREPFLFFALADRRLQVLDEVERVGRAEQLAFDSSPATTTDQANRSSGDGFEHLVALELSEDIAREVRGGPDLIALHKLQYFAGGLGSSPNLGHRSLRSEQIRRLSREQHGGDGIDAVTRFGTKQSTS